MPDQPSGLTLENKLYPQPGDIKLKDIPGGVELTRRWSFKPDDIFIGGIGLFLLVFELGSILLGLVETWGFFEVFLPIIGLIMVYFSLAHRFNSTRVTAGMGKITVRRGPLPWLGNRAWPSAEIVKLSFRGEKHRTRKSTWQAYPLVATFRNGKEIVLDACEKEEQAGFLSQELKRRLSISQ
jgi:hypothetical protein